MDFVQKIKDIRDAIANNKLVIFVGAGVSANSQIPTWTELVKEFAKQISYDKCAFCKEKASDCPDDQCKLKSHLCQDEYLKIPQYYYDMDLSDHHKEYESLIRSTLSCDKDSNVIDDIIFRLRPHHIITTNYDKLLEKSKEPNRQLYSVVTKDKELLAPEKSQYIIKMHGDIDCISEIVLKENDYIEYEQNHLLIQTYIKSLLIDHTFLFVGYSLNDYNLKLILGWINYLAKQHDDIERASNFIIQASESTEYEEKYFSENNVSIIDANKVPLEILEKHKELNISEYGKKIYALLDYIYDEKNDYLIMPLINVLSEKYRMLTNYYKISFEDLLNIHSFGFTDLKGNTLCFYNEEDFNKYKFALITESESGKFVRKILFNAGISSLQYSHNSIDLLVDITSDTYDELFDLYLNNKYWAIHLLLNKVQNHYVRAYYYYVCIPECTNYSEEMQKAEAEISTEKNIIKYIFFKFNLLLLKQQTLGDGSQERKELHGLLAILPQQVKDANVFFKKIFGDMGTNFSKMNKFLDDHEDIYIHGKNSIFSGK